MKGVIGLKLLILNVFSSDLKLVQDLKDHSGQAVFVARCRTFISSQRQMLVNVTIVLAKIIGVHVYIYAFS